MAAEIKFYRGSRPAELTGLDQAAIYFFTDTQEIYTGGKIYGVNPTTITNIQSAITALQAVDVTHNTKIEALETWMGTAKTEILANTNAASAAAQAAATAQTDVNNLELYVGTIPVDAEATTVIAYIQEAIAAANETQSNAISAISSRVAQAETDIDNIEKDYLKAADKTELEGKITAEAEAREAADNALDARIDEVEKFFAVTGEDTIKEAYDTLVEIQKYIDEHGDAAAEMVNNISANTTAIEALDGRMDTAESNINGLDTRLDTAESEIDALQALFGEGEGSVADMIADAIAVEEEARKAADQTLTTNVAAAQAAADKAQGEVDALEGVVATLTETVNTKAAQSDLEAAVALIDANKDAIDALESASHTHDNMDVLDGITSAKVSAWDVAESNAKAYADGLLKWQSL